MASSLKVGWLADDPGYVGGAELTQAEFRNAAPEGIEVVSCPAGHVVPDLALYVIHNHMTYSEDDLRKTAPRVRYHHDMNPQKCQNARHIYCSPLQRERLGGKGDCIPPAMDLDPFEQVANLNHRKGAVCVGRMAYGKGLEYLAEYPEPVDVWSSTPIASQGNARYRGATKDVPRTLASYERFVFLPTALEPFGRAVVEAWAAGLELVVNKNVGARYWIEENPEGLASAVEDFWEAVLG